MAYTQSNQMAGFGKKLRRVAKKAVKIGIKAPFKLVKKAHTLPVKVLMKRGKPSQPAPAYAAPAYAAPSYTPPGQAPGGFTSEPSIAYETPNYNTENTDDLERPMSDDEIRLYIESHQNAGDDVDGIDGIFDKLKKVVKKAVVVAATVKGGPMGKKLAEKLLAKKMRPSESQQSAIVKEAGNEAVSQGIPRAVGEKAAVSFFTPKIMALGMAAIVGVGALVFMMTRKRGR